MKEQKLVLIALLLSLSVGTALACNSLHYGLIFSVFYGVGVFILYRVSFDQHFFEANDKNRFTKPEKEIVVMGEELHKENPEDKKKERFLHYFEASTVVKRKFFGFFYMASSYYLIFQYFSIPIELTSVLALITGFMIIRSVYVGHLFLPLLINIISVLLSYEETQHLVWYLGYTGVLVWTLKTMSDASGKFLKIHRLRDYAILTSLFFMIVLGVGALMPDKLKNEELVPIKKELKLQAKNLRRISQRLSLRNDPEANILQENIHKQLSDIQQCEEALKSQTVSGSQIKEVLANSQNLMMAFQNLQDAWVSGSMDLSSGLKDFELKHGAGQKDFLAKLSQEMNQVQSQVVTLEGLKDLSKEHQELLKALQDKRSDLKQQFEKISQISPEEKEALTQKIQEEQKKLETIKRLPHDREALKDYEKELSGLQEAINKPSPSPEDLKKIAESLSMTPENLLKEESAPQPTKDIEKLVEPLEEKSSLFKKVLPAIILTLLFFVVSYFLRKKGIKKIEAMDPHVLEELKLEMKKLKKLNLSPREEVIHFYNLFHDILQKVHYQTGETPPSCIVYEDMKDLNSKLAKSTFEVTEIYTKTFYGNKEVITQELRGFRKSINRLLSIYNVN